MIECVDEKIWYVNKRKKKSTRIKGFIVFFTLVAILFSYYYFVIVDNVFIFCKDSLNSISVHCVNNTVFLSSQEKINYKDIVSIEKNSNGDIVLIESNTSLINSLSSSLSIETKKSLDKELQKGINIPFTVFLGLKFVAGYGMNIPYKTLEVSKVSCDIKGKFESTGINQTLHTIFLEVETSIKLYMPFKESDIKNTTKVVLCESVIIGKIPDVYLNKV